MAQRSNNFIRLWGESCALYHRKIHQFNFRSFRCFVILVSSLGETVNQVLENYRGSLRECFSEWECLLKNLSLSPSLHLHCPQEKYKITSAIPSSIACGARKYAYVPVRDRLIGWAISRVIDSRSRTTWRVLRVYILVSQDHDSVRQGWCLRSTNRNNGRHVDLPVRWILSRTIRCGTRTTGATTHLCNISPVPAHLRL